MKTISLKIYAPAFFLLFFFSVASAFGEAPKTLTDDEVAQILIKQSISNYKGSCPCPYNFARNGSSCGKRSAYSRPGGASPLCYKSDVTKEMIEKWRAQHKDQPKSSWL